MTARRVLFVDNYDSFSYNVVHLLASRDAAPDVVLNDDPRLAPELLERYDALVVGPGPGRPEHAPQMMAVLRAAIERRCRSSASAWDCRPSAKRSARR